tara:strand:- start:372 stop:539 length:168 start_codon:yes stop_codon:yes gene_type:complete
MALDNATVLENLKKQRAELETQLEAGREMYLKVTGAIEVVSQLVEEEVSETEVVE